MENIIDITYFKGQLHLPYASIQGGLLGPSAESVDIEQSDIERAIAIHQPKFLTMVFGDAIVPEEIHDSFIHSDVKVCPLANYVYCMLLPEYESRSTLMGEKVDTASGSSITSYKAKHDRAWNDMVVMLAEIREELFKLGIEDVYPTDYNLPIYRLQYFI